MNGLEGKVAIVTGASRGIGAAIALDLAKQRAKARRPLPPESTRLTVNADSNHICIDFNNGARAIKIQVDIAHVDAPRIIIEQTLAAFGPNIDILINNAGKSVRKPFLETTMDDFDQSINVNLRGPFFLSQAVVPHLRRPGRIINISSIVSRSGGPLYGVYTASKAGLEAFTRSLAAAVGPLGHSVNSVLPGLTDTDMLKSLTEDDESAKFHRDVASMTPMEGRVASAEEIASVVLLLVSPQSQWITGQSISATGGLLML
ncbi:short-chain dehydrogenase/reductase-like protein SDR [Penicillium brevicompactum]|uniref:Short-chain dehydrogenase/reductase-like protein SDR n=1 Tax=Penicillium brevicompactum TaxID=5074 RepID=A0A9W9QXB6_PENBR|nr:short-chain dehydrogenase/reductase-like protein SDR [Penicillium brevicompactum]